MAALSGDSESVTLTETGLGAGIFEGTIKLRLGTAQPGNGILETAEDPGPPHRFDTLTTTHQDLFGSSSATAGTLGSRTWLVDAAGAEVSSYAFGATIYLRVEDHNANDPGEVDTVQVFLSSPDGDEEWVPLLETASDSGIFAGSIEAQDYPYPYDGLLVTRRASR